MSANPSGTDRLAAVGNLPFGWASILALWFGGLALAVRWAVARLGLVDESSRWAALDPLVLGVGSALLAFAAVLVWALLERLTRADPKGLGSESFFWSLRAMFKPASLVVWVVVPALTGLVGAWVFGRTDAACLFVAAVSCFHLLWLSVLPFAVCRPEVVASTTGVGWWRRPWNGEGTVAAGIIFLLQIPLQCVGFVLAAPLFLLRLPEAVTNTAWLLGEAVGLAISIVIVPACAAALVFRDPPGRAFPRLLQFLRWRGFGPLLVLHARLLLLALFVLPPLVGLWWLQWKVAPGLLDTYWDCGQDPGFLRVVAVRAVEIVGRASWLLPFFAIWLQSLLYSGRIAWHLEREWPLDPDPAAAVESGSH